MILPLTHEGREYNLHATVIILDTFFSSRVVVVSIGTRLRIRNRSMSDTLQTN